MGKIVVLHPGAAPNAQDSEVVLPPGPSGVTPDLVAPSAAYKRSAWLATFGLLSFVAVYLGLTAYFGWLTYRLVSGARLFPGVLGAIPSLFFFGFLVRGLFVVKHAEDPYSIEVFEAEQPKLFRFLHALADATGAPRPHRVFLSARVNACVFYDLSFVNLILPSKKNLEIGLGLLNVLSLDELKAVVAHEFGHFAQRTMAVGRWVYVAQQIAQHIVLARTGFDKVLTFISNIDLRVAWIGWIMRLLVWAIRAVLDTFLRVVILAHRALGRNMELQADRVAVSVSGSDSLIHALHRLGPADDAWNAALSFADEERGAGRAIPDLFALQSRALEHHQRIFDEPELGQTPRLPDAERQAHRVFESKIANPPKMWATHPPNREREDHAKAIYLASVLDPRPSWALLENAETLRHEITEGLYKPLPGAAPRGKPTVPISLEESLARFDVRFSRPSLDPRFRGAYLGRTIAAFHRSSSSMLKTEEFGENEALLERHSSLYPEHLRGLIANRRERREEEVLLEGLAHGALSAAGGVIRHRGEEIKRSALAAVIAQVREERKALEAQLVEHDVLAFSVHREMGRRLGQGWDAYLESLIALLHYATHAGRSVQDAHSYLHHVLDIVLADGSVSDSERSRVIGAGTDLQLRLAELFSHYPKLVVPQHVMERFDAREGFTTMKQKLGISPPTHEGIADFLGVVDGWAIGAAGDFVVLAECTLDILLEAEAHVLECFRDGLDPGAAPAPAVVPTKYSTCCIDAERERQKKLGLWDRFQTADGFLPGLARFGVASCLLLPALFVGGNVGTATIYAYNGLGVPVEVTVGGERATVPANGFEVFEPEGDRRLRIVAQTQDGQRIESFSSPSAEAFGTYVYNVANAAAFVRWTAVYGPGVQPPQQILGAARWQEADEDVLFTEPPESVSSRSGSTHTVLEAIGGENVSPMVIASVIEDPDDARALVAAHLQYEPDSSPALAEWASVASEEPVHRPALLARARRSRGDVLLQRAALDAAQGHDREQLCAAHAERARELPSDADATYLAARCLEDRSARDEAYVQGFTQHPEHGFLAFAAAASLLDRAQWAEALRALEVAYQGTEIASFLDGIAYEGYRAERIARAHGFVREASDWLARCMSRRSPVATVLSIETEEPKEDDTDFLRGFRALRGGDLAFIERMPAPVDETLLVLAGASEGASEALRTRASEISPREVGNTALFALLGLRVVRGLPVDETLSALGRAFPRDDFAALQQAITSGDAVSVATNVEALAATARLTEKGRYLALLAVLRGPDFPATMREELRTSLYVTERPYVR